MTHDHEHDQDEDAVDISAWAGTAERRACPACGEVTTSPGYEALPKTE